MAQLEIRYRSGLVVVSEHSSEVEAVRDARVAMPQGNRTPNVASYTIDTRDQEARWPRTAIFMPGK